MTPDNDCRIPEGVLHAIYRTQRAIEASRRAEPKTPRDPDCPECHGTGVVEIFTTADPCPRGCVP